MRTSELLRSLGAGLVGAVALILLDEATRRLRSRAPRIEVATERALRRGLARLGIRPRRATLRRLALGADFLSSSVYYALVRRGRPWRRGALLGTAAGLVAMNAKRRFGRGISRRTKAMTVGYYLAGGLAAAAASRLFRRRALGPAPVTAA